MMKYYEYKTCTPKCRSTQHADDLIALLTKTSDTQILLSGLLQCWNCQKIVDKYGRSLLHVAASCGRAEVCDWLIKYKKAELQLKTSENGFTPIHCASFYGHIDALALLIRYGGSLTKNDHDRLDPIESLTLDKFLSTKYTPDLNDDLDVYCWGSNANFNLGIGHEMKKSIPELNEYFKKSNVSIVQIVMSKFHSVFRARSGEVFTCGFGIDGRLGHSNETTLITPKLVEQLKNETIIQVAASRNNTYFLTAEGIVYSCGTNEFKQLGQTGVSKALAPRQINVSKLLKGKRVKQVACSRFHCALLTSSNELFTFGLNAGQLGHINERVSNSSSYNNSVCYISEPRLVTSLNENDIELDLVSCSDGCTICLQKSKNVLHVFNDYKSKRLHYVKETGSIFKKVLCYGGKLDCVNPELKWVEELNIPIMIVGLTVKNTLYIWRENDPVWRLLCWSKNKNLKVADFDLNSHGVVLCTIEGLCYKAEFNKTKQQTVNSPQITTSAFNSEIKTEILDIKIIPFLNRCYSVSNDLKSRNFFALQYHPNTNMRYYPVQSKSSFGQDMKTFLIDNMIKKNENESQVNNTDYFSLDRQYHDIELKYRQTVFGLHKFILFSRCAKFFLQHGTDFESKHLIDLEPYFVNNANKFSLNAFEIMINYIYTNECEKETLKQLLKQSKITSENNFIKFINDFKETFIDKFGFTELKSSFDSSNYLKILREINLNSIRDMDERLDMMADFFSKLLSQSILSSTNKSFSKKKNLKFARNSYTNLYDCVIECNNEQLIECHKCILISRSDYFRNMFLGNWRESYLEKIKLPFDADLMQIFLDYLYTDDIQLNFIHSTNNSSSSTKSKNEREMEILFNLYVLSDHLLVERIKNLCEFKLANLVNLKNVMEIFEFSNEYQADQLKEFCMEFISLNLVTLIESKQIESTFDLDLLKDLSKFYRDYFPIVGSRMITPYDQGNLDPNKIDLIPMDLIYDQQFVDGTNYLANIQNASLNSSPPSSSNTKEKEVVDLSSSVKSNEYITNDENEITGSFDDKQIDSNIKWEKVRKKARRKISEKDTNNNQTPAIINTAKIVPKCSNQIASIAPNLNNFPSLVESKKTNITEVNKSSIQNSKSFNGYKEIVEEWPDLNQSSEIIEKKKPNEPSIRKPIMKKTSPPKQVPQSKSIDIIKPNIENKPKLAWGGVNTNSNNSNSTAPVKLLDLINDEMKKVNLSDKRSTPQQFQQKNNKDNLATQLSSPVSRGWNINNDNSISSFAQIIEMEKKSKEQYSKLKNRPLNLIQIEEKAIEDLKRYYNVDSQTNMNILIEVMDELNFNNLAPIWKKN